jgi:hypothetical protein
LARFFNCFLVGGGFSSYGSSLWYKLAVRRAKIMQGMKKARPQPKPNHMEFWKKTNNNNAKKK